MKQIEKASKPLSPARRRAWALGVAAALVMAFGDAVAAGAVVSAEDGVHNDGGQILATTRW